MAEGWLRELGGDRFDVVSAGIEAHGLNPRAVATMGEVDVDITGQGSTLIGDVLDPAPDLVVTVCDHAAKNAPELPARTQVVHWPFPDPAHVVGSDEEVRAQFADVRDAIRARIETWLAEDAAELSPS